MLRGRMGQVLPVDWIVRNLVVAAVVDATTAIARSVAPRFRIHDVVVREGLRFSFLAAQEHLGLEIYISTREQHTVNTPSSPPSISTSVSLVMCKIWV